MSAARTEKSRPSGNSFNAAVNPVLDKSAHLEEKVQWGQAPKWPRLTRHLRACRGHLGAPAELYQVRCSISSSTSLEPKKASISSAKPARVKRTAVRLRQPS